MNSLNINPDSKSSLEDYEIVNQTTNKFTPDLGKGSFGQVKLVKKKSDPNKLFALKIINKRAVITTSNIEFLKREIKIQTKLDHPHIIRLYDSFEDKDNVYLVLEYAENGNLFHYLRKKETFTEREAFVYFFQACIGIDYLHKKGIIHRDLKPENLLLDSRGNVKLCDFGYSVEGIGKRNTFCGTIDYMAPEVIEKKAHDYKVDIWSLGVLLFELTHGYPPFRGFTSDEKFRSIIGKQLKFEGISEDAKDLIKKLLKSDPQERLDFKDIFEHPWLKKYEPDFKIDIKLFVYQPTLEKEDEIFGENKGENSLPGDPKKQKNEIQSSLNKAPSNNAPQDFLFKQQIKQEKENTQKFQSRSLNSFDQDLENSIKIKGDKVKGVSSSPDISLISFEKSKLTELSSKNLVSKSINNDNDKNKFLFTQTAESDYRKKGGSEPRSLGELSNSLDFSKQTIGETKNSNENNFFLKQHAQTPKNDFQNMYEGYKMKHMRNKTWFISESNGINTTTGITYPNDRNIFDVNTKKDQKGSDKNRTTNSLRETEDNIFGSEEDDYSHEIRDSFGLSDLGSTDYKVPNNLLAGGGSQSQVITTPKWKNQFEFRLENKLNQSPLSSGENGIKKLVIPNNVGINPIQTPKFKLEIKKLEEKTLFNKNNLKKVPCNYEEKRRLENLFKNASPKVLRNEEHKKAMSAKDLLKNSKKEPREQNTSRNEQSINSSRSLTGNKKLLSDREALLDEYRGKIASLCKIDDANDRPSFEKDENEVISDHEDLNGLRGNELRAQKKESTDYSNITGNKAPAPQIEKRNKSKKREGKQVMSEILEDLDIESLSRVSRPSFKNKKVIIDKQEPKLSLFARISQFCGFGYDTKPSTGKNKTKNK